MLQNYIDEHGYLKFTLHFYHRNIMNCDISQVSSITIFLECGENILCNKVKKIEKKYYAIFRNWEEKEEQWI